MSEESAPRLIPAYTVAGWRVHWTIDGKVTLCGLPVAGAMGDTHSADCRNCQIKTGERRRASRR